MSVNGCRTDDFVDVPPSAGAVALAFLRRDLAVAASYRIAFLLRTATVLGSVLGIAYLAKFVGDSNAEQTAAYGDAGYLGFWLVGVAGADLFDTFVNSLPRITRRAQLEGTLEAVLATPAPAWMIWMSAPLYPMALGLIRAAVVLGAGAVWLDLPFGPLHPSALAVLALLALAAFTALGLLGGAITLILRHTDPLTALISLSSILLGGILFPVDVLPLGAARLSYCLPLAPALEGLRRALFAGAELADISRELTSLAVFAALAGLLGALALRYALSQVRRDGTLGHY